MTTTNQVVRKPVFSESYGCTEVKNWRHDPTIAAIVRATFPDYRKQTVRIKATASVELQDLNWSGGTRSEYRACKVDGEFIGSTARFHQYAPWDARQVEGLSVPIPQGAIVVCGGHFCGKESTLTLNVNPADMPRLLTKA
jgi:hypothetical protein